MQRTLMFIVEEESMRAFLKSARHRLPIPEDTDVQIRVARGYQNVAPMVRTTLQTWEKPNTRFVVLCDQDKADCQQRKARILKEIPERHRDHTLVRIVCYELESWYFGDPDTLSERYPKFRQMRGQRRFQLPDALQQPSTQIRGLTGGLGKIGLAEELGPIIALDTNTSHSLQTFLAGLRRLLAL